MNTARLITEKDLLNSLPFLSMSYDWRIIMSVNNNAELSLHYDKAKELLNYNPDTGIFTWKSHRSSNAMKGSVAGYKTKCKRIKICITLGKVKKTLLSHRIAWFIYYKEMPKNEIDHINGDATDNRICNLRSVNHQENMFNIGIGKRNKTGFLGVSLYRKTGKYRASISHLGKFIHLGLYETPEEASKVYQLKAKELRKEFKRKPQIKQGNDNE